MEWEVGVDELPSVFTRTHESEKPKHQDLHGHDGDTPKVELYSWSRRWMNLWPAALAGGNGLNTKICVMEPRCTKILSFKSKQMVNGIVTTSSVGAVEDQTAMALMVMMP